MTISDEELAAYVGTEAEPPRVARYDVNEAMVRNWVEAHDDQNPIYLRREVALATGRSKTVCPPAMLSTWVMSGYQRYRELRRMRASGESEHYAYSRLLARLDQAGYTSVVATNVEQTYLRELHPGDHVTASYTIEAISEVKHTGLGEGRFVTLLKQYRDTDDQLLAEERFRLLRFRPPTASPTGV